MATNRYFNKFKATNEQTLVQDLVDETIKIHGVDMVYIPRTLGNEDEIFGEDKKPTFSDGRELEMYVEDFEGFEGEGETMTQFGLQIKDNLTVTVSKRRFNETFADKNFDYPREGDLIFFPLSKGVFEINYVERENNFFNFGKIFSYQLKCSLFAYTGGDFDTGFDQIDGVTSSVMDQLFNITTTSGVGEFTDGETAHLYTNAAGSVTSATISIIDWDTSTDQALVRLIDGVTASASVFVGESSGASYAINTIGVTNDFFVKDAFEDNTEIDFAAKGFLNFSDADPFSAGDI